MALARFVVCVLLAVVFVITVFSSQVAAAAQPRTTFAGTTFNNGHVRVELSPAYSTIYAPEGSKVLAQRMFLTLDASSSNATVTMTWDGAPALTQRDADGRHTVTIQGTMNRGQTGVTITYEAAAVDQPFVGLAGTVEIVSLSGTWHYNLVYHVEGIAASSVQFEKRDGDSRQPTGGPFAWGTDRTIQPSGENSLVALAPHNQEVLFGLNWASASSMYLGTSLSRTDTASNLAISFGTATLSEGEHFMSPAVPIPDGGGGGGGGGGGCLTYVVGTAILAEPDPGNQLSVTGIYGADIIARASSTGTRYEGWSYSSGYFEIQVPNTADTFTVSGSALGYIAPPWPGFTWPSTSVSACGSGSANVYLAYQGTNTPEPNSEWYRLNDNYASVSHFAKVQYSLNVGSPAVSVVQASSEYIPSPPSGNSVVLKMTGTDNSPSGTGYAYAYFNLLPLNLPLSSPMFLSFNVYDRYTPNNNGHVSVDAAFSDGTNLRDTKDASGYYVQDGNQRRVHPAREYFPSINLGPPNYYSIWNRVTVDLTEVRYKTIIYLMVAYDNGQTGGSGGFTAYFDDIRLEMATMSTNVINGGFEQGFYGWARSGSFAARILNHSPTYAGWYSALVGRDATRFGEVTYAEDTQIGQVFRVPSLKQGDTTSPYFHPYLTFAYFFTTEDPGTPSTDYLWVFMHDRTTLQDVTIVNTDTSTGWVTVSFDLTPYKGHIIWLAIRTHHDADSKSVWAYFDAVRVTVKGLTTSDDTSSCPWGSQPYQSCVNMDQSTFQPALYDFTSYMPLSFTAMNVDPTRGGAAVSAGIDLIYWRHGQTMAPQQNHLVFLVSVHGVAPLQQNGVNYFLTNAQLTVKLTHATYENPGLAGYSINLQFATGNNLVPQIAQNNVDPIAFAFTSADGVMTFLDVLELAGMELAPEVVVPVNVAIYVGGLIYDAWKSSNTPTGPVTSASAGPWYANSVYLTGQPVSGLGFGGGSAYVDAILGYPSGAYRIDLSASMDLRSFSCVGSSPCVIQQIETLSTGYSLYITD